MPAEIIIKHGPQRDTNRSAADKVNKAIQNAFDATIKASNADQNSNTALNRARNLQSQLNTLVVQGDSSVEAAQARVDEGGIAFGTLKERLDTKEQLFSTQLSKAISVVESDLIVTVGTSGDYATINEALKALSKRSLEYTKSGYKVEIRLKTGFVMREQILVSSVNLSWITITSESQTVSVGRDSLTVMFGSEKKYPLFGGENSSVLPVIGTLFVMDETGESFSRDGIYLEDKSDALVLSGCGVQNAGGFGIRAFDGCRIVARNAIFNNAKERGCMVSQGSSIDAPGINLSGTNGRNGFRAYRGAVANIENANISNCAEVAVRVSESCVVDMQGADCSGAGRVNSEGAGQALRVFGSSTVYASGMNGSNAAGNCLEISSGSTVVADNSNLSGAGGIGVYAFYGAIVVVSSSTITNSAQQAIRSSSGAFICADYANMKSSRGLSACLAEFSGKIYANNADVSGNAIGFQASRSGEISGTGLKANNCGVGFDLFWEGKISCRSSFATNCKNKAAEVSTASEFKATDCTLTGATNIGVHVYRGSDAYLYGTNCRRGSSDSNSDIVCTTGSIVRANGATGGLNKPANTFDAEGIIFN